MSSPLEKLIPESKKNINPVVALQESSMATSAEVNFPPILSNVGKNPTVYEDL